jgi:hypothetical protein
MKERTTLNSDDNDVYAPFSEACGSRDAFLKNLQLATYCQDRRFEPQKAIRRLRFLSVPASAKDPLPATTPHEAAKTCTKCAKHLLFDAARDTNDNNTSEQISTLRLTDPGDLESCNHYVAVSYCWQQPQNLPENETLVQRYIILDGNQERRSRAPPKVIRRAIDFAIFKGYRLIWVDQECIDQDDVQDKLLHIQAMHLIYRQASDVVAVLNSVLSDQVQVDILEYGSYSKIEERYAFGHLESSGSRREIRHNLVTQSIQLAESLASDPWYTRAWTYQEALLATRPVYLLIPCHLNLRAPSLQIVVGSQLVIYDTEVTRVLDSMQNHLNNAIDPAPALKWPEYSPWLENPEDRDTQGNKLASALAVLTDSVPGWKKPSVDVALEVHRLSALDAIRALLRRGITECLDLIAICGNLCNYSIRINTYMVRKSRIGLSVALFALALLNGNLSLVLALNHNTPCSVTDPSKALPSASIRHVTTMPHRYELLDWVAESSFTCRIRSPTLLSGSLLIRGLLWRVENVDLGIVRQKYIQHEDFILRHECPDTMVREIINAACEFLKEKEETALVRVIENLRYQHRMEDLVSKIMRYHCIPIAIPQNPAISDYRLLPGTAHQYGQFLFNSESETENRLPLFGADKVAYLFTPYRVLIEAEYHDGIPQFLPIWWISSIQTIPTSMNDNDRGHEETHTTPTMTHMFSQGWPSKMKVDESSFFGDAKKLLTSSSPCEKVYQLHCF